MRVRVLHTVWPTGPTTNPFVTLQVENLPNEIESIWFSWTKALLARYDVIHFQWPENLVRASNPVKAVAKRIALRLVIARARIQSIPVAVTVHNLAPHELVSGRESKVLGMVYKSAARFVKLNGSVELVGFPAAPEVVILHGDYSQRYSRRDRSDQVRGRFTFFGAIRAYKNVPGLIEAWTQATTLDPTLSLVVAGEPYDEPMKDELLSLGRVTPGLELDLRKLDEKDLVAYIHESEMIVLPYSNLYNSGAVFLALTIGVPVLVPRMAATEALQDEFGREWVLLYDGKLRPADLLLALGQVRAADSHSHPDLGRRDWLDIGKQYAALYTELARAHSEQPPELDIVRSD